MDSAEPLSSMEPRLRGSLDSTSSPQGNPLRRGISAAAVDRDIVSCIQVQVVTPQFRILFGYLCSGLDRSRFSKFRWALVARFSLLVGWTVRFCGYAGL